MALRQLTGAWDILRSIQASDNFQMRSRSTFLRIIISFLAISAAH